MRNALWFGLAGVLCISSCADAPVEGLARSPIADATGNPHLANPNSGHLLDTSSDPAFAEQVAQCMKKQGFELIPEPSRPDVAATFRGGLDVGSEEFVNRFGFGVSTQLFHQEALPDDLVGFPRGVLDQLDVSQDSSLVFGDLSESEIVVYVEALHGDNGCLEQSVKRFSEDAIVFQRTYADELAELDDAVRSDKRILEREESLRRCVAERGYPELESIDSMIQMLREKSSAIEGFVPAGEAVLVYAPITARQEADLRNLQALELGVANAAFRCNQYGDSIDDLYQAVRREYEEQFVCEHLGC